MTTVLSGYAAGLPLYQQTLALAELRVKLGHVVEASIDASSYWPLKVKLCHEYFKYRRLHDRLADVRFQYMQEPLCK